MSAPAPDSKAAADDFDLAIIGGGPGGYVAAIRGAQLGLKVVVIERADLGGICANWGCIPTKALLHTAEVFSALKAGAALGIQVDNPRIDFAKVIGNSRKIADNQKKGVAYLFKKNGVTHLRGTGALQAADGGVRVLHDGQPVAARSVIVATGARPRALPFMQPDGKDILTYFEAMNLPEQPRRLVVVGAGAIGIEFAYFYNAIGTQVTVLEALPQVLPVEDAEIAAVVEKSLRKQGITIHTGAKLTAVERAGGGLTARFTDKDGQPQQVQGDKILSAIGVTGNVEGFGLEALGAKVERGALKVDERYRVLRADGAGFIKDLYAIGDVIGGALLAHKASAEGVACVESLAGVAEREVRWVNYGAIPGATFCRPEVASVGLTEAKARELGRELKIGRFPFKASGKAQAAHDTEGMVKTVVDAKSGEILGAHIVGGTASDMIATLALARSAELTTTEVLHTVHAHPTFAEIMKSSIEEAYGEAIDL